MKSYLLFNFFLGSIVGFQNPHIISTSPSLQEIESIASIYFPQAKLFSHENSQEKQVANSRRNCQISAYVIDKDPQGLNVRNAPSTSGRILKKLATTTPEVSVDITASQGNWMEINKAVDGEGKTIFQGKGWVYAPLLGTSTRGYETRSVNAYASANNRSRVVGRIPANTSVTMVSCNGNWAYVSHQQIKGWIAKIDQCATSLTTCP